MHISEKVKDRISNTYGELGIYYYDLADDTSFFAGNCDVFPSMGIAKFVLMIEVFQQIEDGKLHLDDACVWEKKPPFAIPMAEYEENVGILDFLHEGLQLTIEDLLYLMMVISDNSAFNILLTKVGMENVNITLKKLGLMHTSLGCLLFEWDERRPEKDNYHSVREIGSLLKRLYKKQLVSISASEEMLRLMRYHQRRENISFLANNKVSVAHQTGFDLHCLHEAAIVYAEKPFILCMSANKVDVKNVEYIMRDIIRLCYEASFSSEAKTGLRV